MKAGFSTDSFTRHRTDGVLEFLRGPELRDRWSALGHHHSNQLDVVTDYRAVIQNDKGLLARTADVTAKRRLARDFSLGDGSSRMQHIEKVCLAIQNQQGNLAKMKDMLADIMERDGVVIPEPRGHAEHQVLAERVRWFTEFDRHLDAVRSTLADYVRFLETRSRVISLYFGLERAKEQLIAENSDWEQTLAETSRRRDDRRTAWESEDSNFRNVVVDHRDRIATFDKQIDGLHADRTRYDEDEADEKVRAYDALDELQAGEELRTSALIDAIEQAPALADELKHLSATRLFKNNQSTPKGQLEAILNRLVDRGYLVTRDRTKSRYIATGQWSRLYDLLAFIQAHEQIDIEPEPYDQQVVLDL
ncbi:MAG: ATP-binding protein [Chromatiaceae bacterium]|nr:ATP-binding protein [Chromatiaceae bacterium]